MAFPYVAEEGFEAGTLGIFDSETDTASKLDYPSYKELARNSRVKVAPYRGAYCMRVDLANTPGTDAYVTETGSFDISADGTLSFGFAFYASPDLTMANNDEFRIWQQLNSTTDEGSIVINYTTANGFRIGLIEGGGSSSYSGSLILGKWMWLSVDIVVDDGGSDDGTLTLYVDGTSVASLSSLDQGAIQSAKLGAIGTDAGTTKGTLLFDQLYIDDLHVYEPAPRFTTDIRMTKTGHAFVGPGEIYSVQLISGAAADNVVVVYDTDKASTKAPAVERLQNAFSNQTLAGLSFDVNDGCYVVLSGTNPQVIVRVGAVPAYSSDGAIRTYGRAAQA